MNFQYLESIDCEMLPSSMYNKETISSINETVKMMYAARDRKLLSKKLVQKG